MKKEDEFLIDFYSGQGKKRGATTVAVLTVLETGQQFKGIAHCNPTDTFNEEVGKKIAESRARKAYFKAVANAAFAQHVVAQRIQEEALKYAQKKANRLAREEKWLANYMATV